MAKNTKRRNLDKRGGVRANAGRKVDLTLRLERDLQVARVLELMLRTHKSQRDACESVADQKHDLASHKNTRGLVLRLGRAKRTVEALAGKELSRVEVMDASCSGEFTRAKEWEKSYGSDDHPRNIVAINDDPDIGLEREGTDELIQAKRELRSAILASVEAYRDDLDVACSETQKTSMSVRTALQKLLREYRCEGLGWMDSVEDQTKFEELMKCLLYLTWEQTECCESDSNSTCEEPDSEDRASDPPWVLG